MALPNMNRTAILATEIFNGDTFSEILNQKHVGADDGSTLLANADKSDWINNI